MLTCLSRCLHGLPGNPYPEATGPAPAGSCEAHAGYRAPNGEGRVAHHAAQGQGGRDTHPVRPPHRASRGGGMQTRVQLSVIASHSRRLGATAGVKHGS